MRKLLLVVCTFLFLTACDDTKDDKTKIQGGLPPESYSVTIGISKHMTHPALDDAERGIIDELESLGYKNLKFDLQNANGEISAISSITNKFRKDKVAVIAAIATSPAQSLAASIKDIPIVFTAVTDPLGAGLRSDLEKEETNVTGVSCMTPVREQIEMLNKIEPINKLGFIYNAGEANSVALYHITSDICKDMGIDLVATTINSTAEVKHAAEFLSTKVDAIYATTDNMVHASLDGLVATAAKHNVPVLSAVPDSNPSNGSIITYGIDYYQAGRQTGKLIARILQGEEPGEIPVKFMTESDDLELYANQEAAIKMGIVIPEEILSIAIPYK